MLQGEHFAIISTSIHLTFSNKTLVLPTLSGHLRQVLLYQEYHNAQYSLTYKQATTVTVQQGQDRRIVGIVWVLTIYIGYQQVVHVQTVEELKK